eukprot:NODE_4501_length_799_cov_890.938667_g4162_i0.p1 GENE.NODE_4501_length_799_cov_890.938667_g4162_i0~~NODE_4501_length_799_cov_890.938667_g4162_i0.p1  ORF type:complete len:228 (+),score=34.40 NODE_4501_length_799_cov_890.938667_g4162_i0:32-715(+)
MGRKKVQKQFPVEMKTLILAALIAGASALTGSNTLPSLTSAPYRWSTRASDACTSSQCSTKNRVNPVWKNQATYRESFQPFQDYVLMRLNVQDYTSNIGFQTATVVACGPEVSDISAGTVVLTTTDCTAMYTADSWAQTFGSELAAAMNGRYVNGVDINNGNSWTNFNGGETDAAPGNNMMQQANHLLCREDEVLATLVNPPDLPGHHYVSDSHVIEQMQNDQSPSM